MTDTDSKNGWLNVSQVAKILDVSSRTVHRYVKDGKLKGRNIKGKIHVSSDSLSEYRDDIVAVKKEDWQAMQKVCGEQLGRIKSLEEREQKLLIYENHCAELEAKNEELSSENEGLKNRTLWQRIWNKE